MFPYLVLNLHLYSEGKKTARNPNVPISDAERQPLPERAIKASTKQEMQVNSFLTYGEPGVQRYGLCSVPGFITLLVFIF